MKMTIETGFPEGLDVALFQGISGNYAHLRNYPSKHVHLENSYLLLFCCYARVITLNLKNKKRI